MHPTTRIAILALVLLMLASALIATTACGSSSPTDEPEPVRTPTLTLPEGATTSVLVSHDTIDVSVGDTVAIEGQAQITLDVQEPDGVHNPLEWASWRAIAYIAQCFALNVDWSLEFDKDAVIALFSGERGDAFKDDWFSGISGVGGELVCSPLRDAIEAAVN